MATVKIGHASVDENGKATGGKAGDQTKKEVCIRDWYKNAKGWFVIRATDPTAAEKIAVAMERACANDKIGYDQHNRDTLYNAAKSLGFDPGRVTVDCETDCSALVRVCCAYAGIMIDNFRTVDQVRIMRKTNQFDILSYKLYTDQSAYLRRGDILVTRKSGHTAVVLNDGDKAHTLTKPYLELLSGGPIVKTLQNLLIAKGYDVGKDGADGDFGGNTNTAVKAYQKANKLEVDGVVGPATWAALLSGATPEKTYRVVVSGLPNAVAINLTGEMQAAKYAVRMEAE